MASLMVKARDKQKLSQTNIKQFEPDW